jgi:hypothetical protein
MTEIGWKFYYLFIVCNLTNALFFWVFLPETAKRPLEGKLFHPMPSMNPTQYPSVSPFCVPSRS